MRELHFQTNISCASQLHQAMCGLACLQGQYCRLSVDLHTERHDLTIRSGTLHAADVLNALKGTGIRCAVLHEKELDD